jgi:cyanate permease
MGTTTNRHLLVLAGIVLSALALRPQIIAIGPLVDAIDTDLGVSHTVTGLLIHHRRRLTRGLEAIRDLTGGYAAVMWVLVATTAAGIAVGATLSPGWLRHARAGSAATP